MADVLLTLPLDTWWITTSLMLSTDVIRFGSSTADNSKTSMQRFWAETQAKSHQADHTQMLESQQE